MLRKLLSSESFFQFEQPPSATDVRHALAAAPDTQAANQGGRQQRRAMVAARCRSTWRAACTTPPRHAERIRGLAKRKLEGAMCQVEPWVGHSCPVGAAA